MQVFSKRPLSHQERYARLLLQEDLGYGLFNPDHHGQHDMIIPGMAGNVFGGHFWPLKKTDNTIWQKWTEDEIYDTRKHPNIWGTPKYAPKPIHTASVNEVSLNAGLIAGIPEFAGFNAELGLHFTDSEAAVLALRERNAWSIDLDPASERDLYNTAVECLTEMGHLLPSGDLVVITGTTTTSEWDNAVFWSDSRSGSLALQPTIPDFSSLTNIPLVKTSFSLHYARSSSAKLFTNHGHCHPPDRTRPVAQSTLEPAGIPRRCGQCCSGGDCPSRKQDQTIFIRGFRFRKRNREGTLKTKATSLVTGKRYDPGKDNPGFGGDDFNPATTQSPSTSSSGSQPSGSTKHSDSVEEKQSADGTIYDSLFDYIFEDTDAAYAVVHDRDLMAWASGNLSPRDSFNVILDPVRNVASLGVCDATTPSSGSQEAMASSATANDLVATNPLEEHVLESNPEDFYFFDFSQLAEPEPPFDISDVLSSVTPSPQLDDPGDFVSSEPQLHVVISEPSLVSNTTPFPDSSRLLHGSDDFLSFEQWSSERRKEERRERETETPERDDMEKSITRDS